MTMRNAYASRGLQLGLHGLAVALILTCFTPTLIAAELKCDNMGYHTTLTREEVNAMQRQLIELGFDPGRNDGLWGPDTRAALRGFCLSATFARNNVLQVMLRNHVSIHEAYPDWQATLESKDFQEWMARQPDAADIKRVRQFGDSSQVIELLQRYDSRVKPVVKPVVKPAVEPVAKPVVKPVGEADYVSYVLTKKDFKKLKSNEKLADRIDQLSAKSYPDKETFKAEAEKALKDVPNADEYVEELAGYGKRQISYTLAKESFDTLKAKNVPDYILQALDGLKGLKYPAMDFIKAMDSTLSELSAKATGLKPKLVQFAVITPAGARITKASLANMIKAYPDDPLVAAIVERLTPREGVTFKSDNALAWAIKVQLMAIGKEIEGAKPLISEAAVQALEFVIDKKWADKVAGEVQQSIVPDGELELISGLKGVDYPEEELFRHAIKARIDLSDPNNVTMKSITEAIDRLNASKVDDKLLAEWKKAKLPAAILDRLRKLQERKFDSAQSFKAAIKESLGQLGKTYEQYLQRIVTQARKQHAFKPLPIQWDGDGYGCVSRNLAGDVYGLYPYWMAGKKQVIDFSMQSRIDYFGVRLDDRGGIADRRHWTQGEDDQSFIREAHTYCAKVDLVVYRDDWRDWEQVDRLSRQLSFKTAAKNIARLVAEPLTDSFSKVIPYLSLGSESVPVMGDGVTLYFPGYPQDEESIAEFDQFIRLLSESLREQGRKYSLNLMFPSADLDKGIYGYSRLFNLMEEIEEGGKLDARFLILLQEPTTSDKKKVRQDIENSLHGENRRKLLRHIAMVITPGGESKQQLEDDVVYAKDNFGGVGFWAQPVMPAAEPISEALRSHYQTGAVSSIEAISGVCKIVCPNRWLFRIAWGICGLILLMSLPLYLQACKWRQFFDKYFLYFIGCTVVPFVLLTFALLSCDPALEEISKGNGILILVIAGIIAYSIWKYRDSKSRAKMP